jgi:hypothetical protein
VKGLLEEAGYQVFNPTLPFHAPWEHWSYTSGSVSVQLYVDTYIKVCKPYVREATACKGVDMAHALPCC